MTMSWTDIGVIASIVIVFCYAMWRADKRDEQRRRERDELKRRYQ
jgi:hypothetical protein